MTEPRIVAFTDGASKGNPGPGGWGVIIVTPDGRVTERGGGSPQTTNNRMELTAAIEALEHVRSASGALEIYADSTYLIQGITGWVRGWERRGWTTASGGAVLNRDLWERLAALVAERRRHGVRWHHVRGHAGTPGNERADAIADGFATGRTVALYDGPLRQYPVPVLDLPDATSLPEPGAGRPGGDTRRAPFAYLSLVDGIPMRHATWAECEARVRGRSGARFRKAMTEADAGEILRAWGFGADHW